MKRSEENEYNFNIFFQSLHQETALCEAAKQGTLDQVKDLVDKGASTDTRDANGVSMYMILD